LGFEEDMIKLVSVLSSENVWVGVSKSNESAQDKLSKIKVLYRINL
jgi:hypothetical protein